MISETIRLFLTRYSFFLELLLEHLQISLIAILLAVGIDLKLGSKVLVMDSGKLQQYDTPNTIKERPASEFVKMLVGRKEELR